MDQSFYSSVSPYGFHGLPTPDQNQNPRNDSQEEIYSSMNNNNFDPSLQLDPTSFVHQPHLPSHSISSIEIAKDAAAPIPMGSGAGGYPATEQIPGRSSSEEKDDLLPPKNRRKEQNRAAQRAFRERKERRVRELEDKVIFLEKNSTSLQADNERLKQELAKSATENEVLRLTSSLLPRTPSPSSSSPHRHSEEQPMIATSMKFMPFDFLSRLVPEGQSRGKHRVMVCEVTGDRLLDAHATWDFIQAHELFKLGLIDIADVSERLKQKAQCDGQGPAFKETEVRKAIEESAARRSDELI